MLNVPTSTTTSLQFPWLSFQRLYRVLLIRENGTRAKALFYFFIFFNYYYFLVLVVVVVAAAAAAAVVVVVVVWIG